jgi:hypothetical protein
MNRCITMTVLALAAALALDSCGGGESAAPQDPVYRIQGAWVSADGERVSTFHRSGEFTQEYQRETYYSLWEIQGDSVKFMGTSSTNPNYQADPNYVGYAPFSFDADGNLILDGTKYTRQE